MEVLSNLNICECASINFAIPHNNTECMSGTHTVNMHAGLDSWGNNNHMMFISGGIEANGSLEVHGDNSILHGNVYIGGGVCGTGSKTLKQSFENDAFVIKSIDTGLKIKAGDSDKYSLLAEAGGGSVFFNGSEFNICGKNNAKYLNINPDIIETSIPTFTAKHINSDSHQSKRFLIGVGPCNGAAIGSLVECNGSCLAFNVPTTFNIVNSENSGIHFNGTEISFFENKSRNDGGRHDIVSFDPYYFNLEIYSDDTLSTHVFGSTYSLDLHSRGQIEIKSKDSIDIDSGFCFSINAKSAIDIVTADNFSIFSGSDECGSSGHVSIIGEGNDSCFYMNFNRVHISGKDYVSIGYPGANNIVFDSEEVNFCNANIFVYGSTKIIQSDLLLNDGNEVDNNIRFFDTAINAKNGHPQFSIGPQIARDDTYLMYRCFADTTKQDVGFIRYDVGTAPANCTIDIGFKLNTSEGARTEFVAFKSDIPNIPQVKYLNFTSPVIPANCSLYEVALGAENVFTKTPMMQLTDKCGAVHVADLCYHKASNKVFVGIDHSTQIAAGEYTLSVFGM